MTSDRDAQLCALLDGALAAAEEAELRAELGRDPALAARLVELARVDAALRALPARPVPADLRARLQAKLDAAAKPRARNALRTGAPPGWSRRLAWGAGLAAAAAAAALVAQVGVPWLDDGTTPGPPVAVAPTSPGASSETSAGPTPAEMIAAARESEPARAAVPQDSAVRATPAAATAPVVQTEIARAPTAPAGPTATAPAASAPPETELAVADSRTAEPEEALAPAPRPELQLAEAEADRELPLLVDISDEEAAALAELELEDAGVVAVLDVLDDLDALEAEAS